MEKPKRPATAEQFKREFAFGVVVLGTEAGCGKTVFMTGLSAALREEGFPTRAIKPFVLASRRDAESELAFISSVSHTPVNYPVVVLEKPSSVVESNWQHAVMMTTSREHLTFVEMPGSCATPVSFEQNAGGMLSANWKDSADFACDLGLPCLLVAKHNKDALEKIILALSYLNSREARIVGVATVETNEFPPSQQLQMTRPELELALMSRTNISYLGAIEHSPSISVPRVNQGNLIKVTSSGVDLLHILRKVQHPAAIVPG